MILSYWIYKYESKLIKITNARIFCWITLLSGLHRCLSGKELSCNAEDMGSTPELGRFPGEGNGNPLQYSCLENHMDRRLNPGGLQSIGLQRVGHDLMTENSKQHFCQSNKINNLNFLSSFIYQLLCAYCSGWSNHCTSFKNLLLISIRSLRYRNQKQESSRKTSISALLTMPKPLTLWITRNCGKFWKRWEYQTTWPASWEICMQVRKQQLELDMEQQTGSK